MISDGFAADTIFPAPGMDGRGKYKDRYMKSSVQNAYGSGTIRT